MGYAARTRAGAPEIMLPISDVPIVAMLALMDALLIDMERTEKMCSGDRAMRAFRAEVRAQIRADVERLHNSFKGRVTDELVTKCDRYLCRVQDSMDSFFDDITAADLADMERVKGNWPQHTEG